MPLALTMVLAAVFLLWPQLDLWAHRFFYDVDRGGFFARDWWLWSWIYHGIPWVVKLIGVSMLLALAIGLWRKRPILGVRPRVAAYLLLVLAVGPGLLVNTVFKDQWGRARPSQIQEFGGDKLFTPPILMADQCERNCSFVSGHASVGFYLMTLAWVVRRYRWQLLAGGVAAGLLTGLARMAQGGHFASDVLFSGLVVYFTSVLLYRVLFKAWPTLRKDVS